MIPFIDIASYQQGRVGIDWPAVAAYLTGLHPEAGVIVKLSEGTNYRNEFRRQQRQGAHAAGIKSVGLYHYGRPSKNSGSAEADYFLATVGEDGGVQPGEFYCLDMEDENLPANADLDAYVLDFTGRLARSSGLSIVLYSGKWYADPHNLNRDPKLAELGLWLASVGSLIPPTPEPWKSAGKSLLLWQYNWHGRVPGIVGDVDLDYLVGPIETLRPYQWGFQVNPLQGPTDVPLDVPGVADNSESLDDQKRVAAAMRTHTEQIITAPVGAQLADIASKLKAEADWLVRSTWSH
jgi:GH25 family lysozyme M1 (1,4-beta-N-acetylmuramidase)